MSVKETPSHRGTIARLRESGNRVISRIVHRKEPISNQQAVENEADNLVDLALFGVANFSERFSIKDRWGIYPYQLDIFNYWFAFYALTKNDYELKKLSDSEAFVTDRLKPVFLAANRKDQNTHEAHILAAEWLRRKAQDASDRFIKFVGNIIVLKELNLKDQKNVNITNEVLKIIGSPSSLRNAANIFSIIYYQWQEGQLSDEEFAQKAEDFVARTKLHY